MGRRAKTALTDTAIRGLKRKSTPYRKADGNTPRLYIVVPPKLDKFWEYWFTSPEEHRDRPYKLGDYPAVSISDARKGAGKLKKLVAKGIDPILEDAREKARQEARDKGTLHAMLGVYLEAKRSEGKDRYASQVEKDIKLSIPEDMLAAPADSITEADVIDWMNDVVTRAQERGFPGDRSADFLKAYISAAYEFILKAKSTKWKKKARAFAHLTANPALRIGKFQTEGGVGQRVIDADEFTTLYKTVGVKAMSADLALFVKLAFHLGGQRVEELLHAPWSEFDTDDSVWTIPIERRKVRSKARHQEPHLAYITPTAAGLLKELHEHTGHTPWLFPDQKTEDPEDKREKMPRTTSALNQAIRRYCEPGKESKRQPFKRFTPRDIRRSVKTLMGEAGLSLDIRNRIQGHAFQDVGSKHYDRWSYWPEKQQAMLHWEHWLNDLVSPGKTSQTSETPETSDNVIKLGARS